MIVSIRTGLLVAMALLLSACGGGSTSGESNNGLPFGLTATSPAPGATGVALDATVSVTAANALNAATINGTTFSLAVSGGGGAVSGTISVNDSTATFTPDFDLAPSTQYTATITTGAKDVKGGGLTSNFSWSFTTVTVPSAPIIGTATAGDAQATVTFLPPASNGGAAITSYTVTSNPGGITASGAASPITVGLPPGAPLINGTPYTFTVTASNIAGTSPPSAPSNSVTPSLGAAPPGQPTFGAPAPASVPGNGQVTVNFNAPAVLGTPATILGYTVTAHVGGVSTGITASGGGTSIVVPGLTNGTAYTFTVVAFNSTGPSIPSAPSGLLTPVGPPGAPTGVSASATAPPGALAGQTVGTATVTFSAPASNGGSAIAGYTVTSNPGGPTIVDSNAGSPTLSHVVTGLVVGTPYTFTVTATNGVALTGPPSAPSGSVIPTPGVSAPGAPPAVSAVAGNGQATVNITAPPCALPGCPAISNYVVTALIGGVPTAITASGGGTSILVSGLTNGTAYTFRATASNSVGTSPASPQSNSVTPVTVPGAPTAVVATAGNAEVAVSFAPPASNGGAPIINYSVTSNPGGFTAVGGTSPIVVTGLTNGVAYTFTVQATNSAGTGAPSAPSGSATPVPATTAPSAPTAAAAVAGNAQATVTFSVPASDGGSAITGYTVTSNPPGGVDTNAGTTGLSHVITGLTNGVAYTFAVTATNSVGTSPASAASNSVTPATVPGAPTAANAIAGDTQATVSFTPPASNGGAPILGYTVTSSPGLITASGSTSPIVVPGLTNTTSYTFTVRASNSVGTGPASAASNSVTPNPGASAPGAPTGATATAGNGQATVTFSAPASNGGSAITGYTVTSSPPGGVDTNAGTTGLSHVITGLTNGTAYTFTVTATNVIGTGPASGPSNSVTPATVPGSPTAASAVAGNGQATVSFTPPASNGGAAITSYSVENIPDGTFVFGASSPILVTGLTNGNNYMFRVRAINSAGTGPGSAVTNSVTPSAAATVPGAPTAASATGGDTHATVTFSAPASNGGSAITGYTVTSNPPGGVDTNAGSTGLSHFVTGLTNGVAYTFTVTATNAVGTGPASGASNSVTPATLPGAPTAVNAIAGNGQATVSFTPPASNGGSAIINYTVIESPGGAVVIGSASPIVVTGLTNGVASTFTVAATNGVGTGPASAVSNSVTPTSATVPGAPTGASATAGNGQATVTFSVPGSDGGSPITGYTVTSTPPGGVDTNAGTTGLSHVITGLTNGVAYTFRVTASNAVGTSLPSAASNSVTPASAPGAPTGVTASPGNSQATVSFTAPASNGGSAITSYTVTSSPGNFTGTGATSPIVVGSLSNGTAYTFTVTATNAIGTGPASAASNSVTPAAIAPACSSTVPQVAGAISLRAQAARSSGVAPLAVFFDASATTSSATTRPFHDIEYRWDFGDPAGGAMWATGSRAGASSKNEATGPVTSHLYDPALGSGTQAYVATVTAFDGTSTVSCSISVSVSDPTTAFPLGNTVCFSNDNDFTGCPAGATQVPFSSNFVTVASTATAGNTVRRLLLKRGGTWNVAATTAVISTAGPGIIGAFGTSPTPPLINATFNGQIIRLNNASDWRVMDIDMVGNGGLSQRGFRNTTATNRMTFLRMSMNNLNYPFLLDIAPSTTRELSFVELNVTNSGEYGIYVQGSDISLLGNTVMNVGTQHVVRFPELHRGTISNNTLGGGVSGKHIIKIHAPTGSGSSDQFVISDNDLRGGGSQFMVDLAPQTDNNNEIVREAIVERNRFKAGPGFTRGLDISASEITARNNICDLTLPGGTGGACIALHTRGSAPAPTPTNIRLYNNTAFSNDPGFFEVINFADSTAINVTARNNLGSAPVVGGSARMIQGTPGPGFVQANNVLNNNPMLLFGTAVPSAMTDFSLAPPAGPNPAIDKALTLPSAPVFSDFFRTPRPHNGVWDIGAVECAPPTCP